MEESVEESYKKSKQEKKECETTADKEVPHNVSMWWHS